MFSAFVNVLMLSVPIYMMQLYDRVLSTRSVDTLVALSVMVAAALVVLGLLDALRNRIVARVGGWLERELGGTVLSGAVADALRVGGGVSAQGLRDLSTVRGYAGSNSVIPLFDAPWAPIFVTIIFLIHPILGWIAVGGAAVLFVCAVLNDLTTRKKLAEANSASTRALNAADAAIGNADAIAAMGMLPNLVRRWQTMNAQSGHLADSATDISGGIAATAKATRFGLQVAVLGVGAYLVILNEMSPGSMIAAAIILSRAPGAVRAAHPFVAPVHRRPIGLSAAERNRGTSDRFERGHPPAASGRSHRRRKGPLHPSRGRRAGDQAGQLQPGRRGDAGGGGAVGRRQDDPGASHRRFADPDRGTRAPGMAPT